MLTRGTIINAQILEMRRTETTALYYQNLLLTAQTHFIYISLMQKIGVVLLCLMIITLLAPLQGNAYVASPAGDVVIFTLDVCSSDNSLTDHRDISSLAECPCTIVPAEFAGFHNISQTVFIPFLIPSQEEHPPKV